MRHRCLVLTPATRWGSWAWLEKVIARSGETADWIVVSYGRPFIVPRNMRVLALPAVNYITIGRLMSRRGWWPLNLIYYLPLMPVAWIAGIVTHPTVLVANGIVSALVLLPLKVTGARLVLVYHGYAGHFDHALRSLLRWPLSKCDAAVVNSPTSLEDLSGLIDPRRITTVSHPADDSFFSMPLSRPARDKLLVLFVGRLDEEKFAQCLRVCRRLASQGIVELWAVGKGPLESNLDFPGSRAFGYIHEREKLVSIYGEADIVWAPADVTYLSLPGVEALAAGCPVIVSDIPAVEVRADLGIRIPRDLVPGEIGRVVSGADDEEAEAFLRSLSLSGISAETREACRHYAIQHHSSSNIDAVTQILFTREH